MRLSIVSSAAATALAGAALVLGCQSGEMVSAGAGGSPAGQAGSRGGSGGSVTTTGHGGSGGSAVAGGGAGGAGGVSSGTPGTTGSGGMTTTTTTRRRDAGAATPDGSADATTPPPNTTPTGTAAGSIVPLYTDPGDPSWTAIVTAKQAHPTVKVVAIVNPSNGPGGSRSQAYTTGIASLQAAGIDVIGYVATGYGSRATSTVEADIDSWKSFYPTLVGIFFDEQSDQAQFVPFYTTLSQYAKSKGLTYTVGNPGTDTSESYIGVFDTMLIYESKGVSSVSALAGWHTKYPPSNFGVIPYGTPLDLNYVKQARTYVEYIYLNNDDLPNPWDSLPPYFSDLLTALE